MIRKRVLKKPRCLHVFHLRFLVLCFKELNHPPARRSETEHVAYSSNQQFVKGFTISPYPSSKLLLMYIIFLVSVWWLTSQRILIFGVKCVKMKFTESITFPNLSKIKNCFGFQAQEPVYLFNTVVKIHNSVIAYKSGW